MFPIISAVTILPVLFLGFFALDSYALLLVGGFFLGIAGTAFAVGVPFVNAWFPPERRGLAIGIFGAGMGGTAISALTTVKLFNQRARRLPFLITAAALAVVRRRRLARSCATPPGGRADDQPGQPPQRQRAAARSPGRPASSTPSPSAATSRSRSTCRPTSRPPTASPRPTPPTGWPASWWSRSSCARSVAGSRTGSDRSRPGGGVRRRGRRCRDLSRRPRPSNGIGTVAFLAMAAALGAGSGGDVRADRQGDRPGPGRRCDRARRRRGRPRWFRAPADHGLRLRSNRLVCDRAAGCCRSPPLSLWSLTADPRPPDRRRDRKPIDRKDIGMDGPLADALVRSRGSSPRGRSPTTCGRCRRSAAARPTTSTATGGATTRWCAPPTA